MSQYTAHKARWSNCRLCPLWEHRTRIVLARGTVPAPLVFVGEAPGPSENVLGKPFIGPAGKLLDEIILRARVTVPYALTNLVACIPLDDAANKFGQPPDASVLACQPRLDEFIELCQPQVVVTVGAVAKQWCAEFAEGWRVKRYVDVIHPAAILRMNVMQQGLAIQRGVARIAEAVEGLQ